MDVRSEERWAEQRLLKHKLSGSVSKTVDDYTDALGLPEIPNIPNGLTTKELLAMTARKLYEDRGREFTQVTESSTDGAIDSVTYKFNSDSFRSAFAIAIEKLTHADNREEVLKITA